MIPFLIPDRRAWDGGGESLSTGSLGEPIHGRVLLRGFRSVVTDARLGNGEPLKKPEQINWHCLRHTAASQWILRGADVFTVSRRLGHSSAAFTMDTYSHLLPGQQKAAAEALDHLLASG